jgi:UDP-2-acetamido-3-amino-2,3-dideoxy-glucuronate N-acetyltransferase
VVGSDRENRGFERGLMAVRIHDTAIVEHDVEIGDGTAIWDNVHIRSGARIGRDCIVGEKTYIGQNVLVADLVKLNAFVYVCMGVTIERGVMVSAHVTFTNDRYPRATTPELDRLRPSEADELTLETTVREGATIGAGAVIGPGIELGRFSMTGMGSVVTRSIADFGLVIGTPGRLIGYVCRCGTRLGITTEASDLVLSHCDSCDRQYVMQSGRIVEASDGMDHTP